MASKVIRRNNGEVVCLETGHTIAASRLTEDCRILLKDLRVLTVTRVERGVGWLTIHYYELAAKERGSLEVSGAQQVKILCDGRCPISRELDHIL